MRNDMPNKNIYFYDLCSIKFQISNRYTKYKELLGQK